MARKYALGFSFLLLLSTRTAHSQVFEAGYVVLMRGDTLRGEVQNAFWEEPPTTILLRTGAAPATSISAEQVRSVYVSSGRLLRREVLPLDRLAQVRPRQLTRGIPRNQQPEELLADVWVDGAASLIGVTLDGVRHFFTRREQQPWLEMAERQQLVERNGQLFTVDANDYHNQLARYFADCPAAVAAAEKAPFTGPGLTRVVQSYNQSCSAARTAGRELAHDQRNRPKVAVQIGFIVGGRYNSSKLRGPASNASSAYNLDGFNVDGRVHGQAGAYLDFLMPGRRLALHTALTAAPYGRRGALPAQLAGEPAQPDQNWRGLQVVYQFGLRHLFASRTTARWLLGAGYEINLFGNSTTLYSNQGFPVLDQLPTYYGGTILPYVEVGWRYKRYALIGTGRVYKPNEYRSVYAASPQNYSTVAYRYTPWSVALALHYRLNRDAD